MVDVSSTNSVQVILPRRCVRMTGDEDVSREELTPLADFRELEGYALLGDPGSGKTSAFEDEARACKGTLVSAGDFLVASPSHWPDPDVPLFIDALDETRAGTTDGRLPLASIVEILKQIGSRRVRISCRAADWLGNPDVRRLQSVLPAGAQLHVLRLSPLTLEEVAQLLRSNFDVDDPESFIERARHHRLEDLLFNPQTLGMLAKAVGGGNEWPQNRRATYELACARLAEEHNEEHDAATRTAAPNFERVRRAAGYLSALLLISDLRGFTLSAKAPTRALSLNSVPNGEQLPLRVAVASRLFKEISDGVFAPVHRTVADYLAADFLGTRIGTTLTVRRTLALIRGVDGGVVSGLRGLNAWLATLSPSARRRCSEIDPMGVLAYGDVVGFTACEKEDLLNAMQAIADDAAHFRWKEWNVAAFAALATPEMQDALQKRFNRGDHSESAQTVLTGLAQGIEHVGATRSLLPALEASVRDPAYDQHLRRAALAAYVKVAGSTDTGVMQLLLDVTSSRLEDKNDELLGTLLELCYPTAISPSEVVQYLRAPKDPALIGRYTLFWTRRLSRATPSSELGALLDAFASVRPTLRESLATHRSMWPVGALLSRALDEIGDAVDNDRLLNWLDAGCDSHGHSVLDRDDTQKVQAWFKGRPQSYLEVLERAISRWVPSWRALSRLHSASPPADMAFWWLARAEREEDLDRARDYLAQATSSLPERPDANLDAMLADCWRVAHARGLEEQLERLLSSDLEQFRWKQEEAAGKREEQHEAVLRREAYLRRLPQLELPNAPIELLNELALAYSGHFYNIRGGDGKERLAKLVGDDVRIVEAALKALKAAVLREDLPTVKETLTAHAKGALLTRNRSALVGMEIQFEEDASLLCRLPADKLKAILVAHFVDLGEPDKSWIAFSAEHRTDVFADALAEYVEFGLLQLRKCPFGTHAMRRGGDYEGPARLCLIRLLQHYPARANLAQNQALSDLLHGALDLVPSQLLLSVIQDRLAQTKMDGRQRAMWLAAGLRLRPDAYLPQFEKYLERSLTRVRNVARFLQDRGEGHGVAASVPTRVLVSLVEHLARGCEPERLTGLRAVTDDMRRADLVRLSIDELAARADKEAAAGLQRLEDTSKLSRWSRYLRNARGLQQIVMRDASFEPPTPQAVWAALEQGPPTKVAEIAAIAEDTLEELALQVRGSEFNLRRQFWNLDGDGKPEQPKHEEDCRDALGELLKVRLERFGIACIPENHHVEGKRSDLWCMVGSAGVPIEAKRDRHPALWTAARGQLLARYASDPRAKGYGIYLVFWFGNVKKIPAPALGARPHAPEELRSMLINELTPQERQMVSIHVIDCSF